MPTSKVKKKKKSKRKSSENYDDMIICEENEIELHFSNHFAQVINNDFLKYRQNLNSSPFRHSSSSPFEVVMDSRGNSPFTHDGNLRYEDNS